MKKIVPDPPPTLCVGPGLSHEEAITRARNISTERYFALPIFPTLPKHTTVKCSATPC